MTKKMKERSIHYAKSTTLDDLTYSVLTAGVLFEAHTLLPWIGSIILSISLVRSVQQSLVLRTATMSTREKSTVTTIIPHNLHNGVTVAKLQS